MYWDVFVFCGQILKVVISLPATFVVVVFQLGLFELFKIKAGVGFIVAEALTVIVLVEGVLFGILNVSVTEYEPVGKDIGKGVFSELDVTLATLPPEIVLIVQRTVVF
jgi:hypothetical protein